MPKKTATTRTSANRGGKTLSALRAEIDSIDSSILKYINRRARVASKIADAKKMLSKNIYDPLREKQVERKVCGLNKGPLSEGNVASIFREIIRSCRALQSEGKVSYLGPGGSFSHQAASGMFGSGSEFVPRSSIEDVFESVLTGSVSRGVVPIENSTEGSVASVLETIAEGRFLITGETYEPINHFMLSKTGGLDGIEKVASHPQALGQCRRWLSSNLPGAKPVELTSTAAAAALAAKDGSVGAVSSAYCASIYGLRVAAENIEDNPLNATRFVAVEKADGSAPDTAAGNKVSIAFSIKDRPGALHKTLFSPLASAGVNLTRIESRPSGKKPWEYNFFVDFECGPGREETDRLLSKIEAKSSFFKVLGCYASGESG
ncbi:MAG: prephenate dehydratase [Candidatus Dadabacteria bacterium]|nr:prephenate dehydratase [Candidatus Dadabacteria bacterium]